MLNSGWHSFWLSIVGGSFGAGKTKNVFLDSFLWKKKYPYWLLIANVPYDFVDVYFEDKNDLNKIFERLKMYIEETNTEPYLRKWQRLPIRLILDEAHLYFFSREFKKFATDDLLILTQCRKRNIQMFFITQELAQIDVLIRRLVPYVYWYQKILFWFRRQILYYFKTSETSDIWDEINVEIIEKEILRPNRLQKLMTPTLKYYFEQRFLTYHVVWSLEKLFSNYEQFLERLIPNLNEMEKHILENEEKNTENNNKFENHKIWWTEHFQN